MEEENLSPQTNTNQHTSQNQSPPIPIKNKSYKKLLVIGILMCFIVVGAFLYYSLSYRSRSNLKNQNPNFENNKNEFIIYHKNGYIWKSDLLGNNQIKIIPYPLPSAGDDIMWDISPDNKDLLISIPKKGLLEINLTTLESKIIDPNGGYGLYSPDNKAIYYIQSIENKDMKIMGKYSTYTATYYIIKRDGTGKYTLPEIPANLSPQTWSSDGKYIVYNDSQEFDYEAISTINVQTKQIAHLIRLRSEDSKGTFFSPAWSPDGTAVCAFTGYYLNKLGQSINTSYVTVIDVASKTSKKTKSFGYGANSFCYWAPNSQAFAIPSGDSQISIYDKNANLIDKINVPGIIEEEYLTSPDSNKEISWSPDGKKMIINASGNLLLVDVHTHAYQKIMSGVTQTNFATYWSKK